MNPINNSDTAWLIVSDYNQDNDLFYEELREDILNPEMNDWYYEATQSEFDPYPGFTNFLAGRTVGSHIRSFVGISNPIGYTTMVGGILCGEYVGGNSDPY
jgi:hypothetical protein